MSSLSTYIDNLTEQVDSIDTCEQLQAFKTEIEDALQSLLDDMNTQLEALIANSTPPVDLDTTIIWITNQIKIIVSQIQAIQEEIQAITGGMAKLLATIAKKASTLGCDWSAPQ